MYNSDELTRWLWNAFQFFNNSNAVYFFEKVLTIYIRRWHLFCWIKIYGSYGNFITRKTRKGETHQKVELIFDKVSGLSAQSSWEHNNIINVEVFFFIFPKQSFHMRFNAEFLESFSIRNLIMHFYYVSSAVLCTTTKYTLTPA